MFKFFKRIRQDFVTNFFAGKLGGNLSKYLVYALGEIILVVIGIFIAIQLNDGNQDRIEAKQFTVILENLESEFGRTQELISKINIAYESSLKSNLVLLRYFNAEKQDMDYKSLDSLIGKAMNQAPFYPTQPILDELTTSGKLKSLKSEQLKGYIYDLESNLEWFHFDYDLMISFSNFQLQPFLNKHWSWRNIDVATDNDFLHTRSSFKVNAENLFQQLEFENLVDNNLYHTNRLYKRLKRMEGLIDKIRNEINTSLNTRK